MPYNIHKQNDKYLVVGGKTTKHIFGTHDSKEKARQQQKALYANTKEATMHATQWFKLAGPIWNNVAGGAPYTYGAGVRQAISEHPELTDEQAAAAQGGFARPLAASIRSVPHALGGLLAGGAGGALLGAGVGAAAGAIASGDPSMYVGPGAAIGGGVGGLGGMLTAKGYKEYDEGRNLTNEYIANPEASTYSQHPWATSLGVAALPINAANLATNPVGALGFIPGAAVGIGQHIKGRPV